jgi:hypothetical protein
MSQGPNRGREALKAMIYNVSFLEAHTIIIYRPIKEKLDILMVKNVVEIFEFILVLHILTSKCLPPSLHMN